MIETVNEKAYNKHFITSMKQDLQLIFQLTANQSEKVIPVEYKEQQCFLLHAYFHRNLVLHCMKLSPEGNIEPLKELVIYTEDVVLQVFRVFYLQNKQAIQIYLNLGSHSEWISIHSRNGISCRYLGLRFPIESSSGYSCIKSSLNFFCKL